MYKKVGESIMQVSTAYIVSSAKRDEYLLHIYNKYLCKYKIAVTTQLLNNVFFNSYAQAYSSIKRMCELNLLQRSNKNKNYYFVTKK